VLKAGNYAIVAQPPKTTQLRGKNLRGAAGETSTNTDKQIGYEANFTLVKIV
jgi:hypothetical protein